MFSGACNMKEGRSNLGFLPSEEKKLELSAVQPEKRKLPF
jgi:hypothetical protein